MSTAIANLQTMRQQLAERLQATRDAMPPSTSTRIQITQDKKFKFPDGSTSAEPFEAVIVAHEWFNALYTKRYVPGEIEMPACWAASRDANTLAPNDTVKKPINDTCAGCPKNEWGSDPQGGRGKACGNKVRLGLVPPDATNKSPVWTLDLAPTSQGFFVKFLREMVNNIQILETLRVKIGFDPKTDYAKVVMQVVGDIPDTLVPHLNDLIIRAIDVVKVDFDYT